MSNTWINKVVKIIPMLASENEIEVVSGINGIKRILKANGKTFYDICNLLTDVPGKYYGHAYKHRAHKPKRHEEPDLSDQIMKADFINNNNVKASKWEMEFWEDIQWQIYKIKLTEKQMSVVNRIYERAKKSS